MVELQVLGFLSKNLILLQLELTTGHDKLWQEYPNGELLFLLDFEDAPHGLDYKFAVLQRPTQRSLKKELLDSLRVGEVYKLPPQFKASLARGLN